MRTLQEVRFFLNYEGGWCGNNDRRRYTMWWFW